MSGQLAVRSDRDDQSPPEVVARLSEGPSIRGEVLIWLAIGVILAALAASMLADRHLFFGFFSDTQELIWQASALQEIIGSGSAVVRNAFFGVPTPYAYWPVSFFEILPFIALRGLGASVWFAYNMPVFLYLVLNFTAMYWVLRRFRFGREAAFLAALAFGLAPQIVVQSFSHAILVPVFPIPLLVYLLVRLREEPERLRVWAAIGALIALMFWIMEYHGFLGVIVFVAVLAFRLRALRRGLVRGLAIWALAFGALFAPIAYLYAERAAYDRGHGVDPVRSVEEGYTYSASPGDYLFPSALNPVYQHVPRPFENIPGEFHNYVGLLGLGSLAWWFVAGRRRREPIPWRAPLRGARVELLVVGITGFLTSMGPMLRLNETFLRLPIYVPAKLGIPPFDQIRVWGRFGIWAFAALTFLIAHAVGSWFSDHRFRRRTTIALLALATAVVAVDQFPYSRFERHRLDPPPLSQVIKEDPGRFYVLHLPLYSSSGALFNVIAQFGQVFHGKPIVNGYSSFPHAVYERRLTSSPLVCLNYPQIKDLPFEGDCSFDRLAADFVAWRVRYIFYERKTRWFIPPVFLPEDDRIMRRDLRRFLNEMERRRVVMELHRDQDWIVFRVIGDASIAVP